MHITYKMLEQQNKDLRTRLSNNIAKNEIDKFAYLEQISALKTGLGEMPAQILMLQKYIENREREIDRLQSENTLLKRTNHKLEETIERLKLIIGKLKGRMKKDSSTSDKPSSTDVFHKPTSLREKSDRKPGGQQGHKGYGLSLFENPTEVIEIRSAVCQTCERCDECDAEYTAKQKVDINFVVNIIEERVYHGACPINGKIVSGKFSEGFVNPVQYGENLKSVVAFLSEHGCISVAKTAEIINSICGDQIKISWGTVVNIQRELSEKLEETIEIIKAGLIAGDVLNADETGCRVNGSLGWAQTFCNNRFALFGFNEKRGGIDDSIGILSYFTGILVHDHFISYYNLKYLTHAECNEHILRHIKSLIEIFKHPWLQEMSELLKSACHEKNELKALGKTEMPEEIIQRFSDMYDAIIRRGQAEYENATIGNKKRESYYADERRLLARLAEYKDEHLLFLNDFRVPFTNNGAEQVIRVYKNRQKVSGCFRSIEGARIYARILSLIKTLKKQDKNIFNGIKAVFSGEVPIAISSA